MNPQEEWRPVIGFPDYMVSSQGRVASHKRRKPLVMRTINHRGYLYVTFSINDKTYTRSVHRMLTEAFHGPAEDGQVARHLNGNPLDNRVENLAWGTYSDNNLDAVSHGTHGMTRKTHCPQGHPYDETNTRIYRRMRYCITCQRSRSGRGDATAEVAA